MGDIKILKARRKAAQVERDAFQPLLDEAYTYAIPYRRSTRDTGKGEKRVDKAFDHTAVVSAFRFAGKLQQDLWPPGQENFRIEPGPLLALRKDNSLDELRDTLEDTTAVTAALFNEDWDQSFHEMALDLSAGTGAMLITQGEAPDEIAKFTTVPIDELLIEAGRKGIFWCRRWSLREIEDTWPDAPFPAALQQELKDKPEAEYEVYQDTVWDRKARRWVMTAWMEKPEPWQLSEDRSVTCPWLTPRYFRVAGETYGRGPVMLAMPSIKTLNTAQRYTLQAAAIAMLGIYTAVDDGVFNPDLAAIEPGTFWKVARNGGTMGPSVSKFPEPRLDLTQIVLNDLRMGVQAAMMDQSLPPDGAAVRSATEILERIKRLASDHLGAFGRLVSEVVVPAVRRVIELAYNAMLIPQNIPIDQLIIKVKVTSPLALAREAERVQKIIEWLQLVLMLAPLKADEIAKIVEMLADVGRMMGVSNAYILTKDERAAVQKQKAAEAAAMALAQAAAAAGGKAPKADATAAPAALPAAA